MLNFSRQYSIIYALRYSDRIYSEENIGVEKFIVVTIME